jgi:hypothetical protein
VFEKIGRLAEAAASNVGESRRGFLGRLGQGALAAVALLGGVFASSAAGQSGVVCCFYQCPPRRNNPYFNPTKKVCQAAGTTCASTAGDCFFIWQSTRAKCGDC